MLTEIFMSLSLLNLDALSPLLCCLESLTEILASIVQTDFSEIAGFCQSHLNFTLCKYDLSFT